MSSIAEALKRAQQDRERLRTPGKQDSGAAPLKTEPSLAAVVLKRSAGNGPVAEVAVPAPREIRPQTEEGGLARAMNLSPTAEAPAAEMRMPEVKPVRAGVAAAGTAVATHGGTTLTAAIRQAGPQVAPAVRQEQRLAETIVEDYTSKRRLNLPASMVVYHDRAGAVAEQYRKMRDNLVAMSVSGAGRRECQVMVISSAVPGEGKTVTTLNLGLSLVELRANRVLLIDGCLESNHRRPALTDLLRLRAEKGLAELLASPDGGTGEAGMLEGLLKATPWHHLLVLPAGARTPAPAAAALLQSQNLRAILRKVRANFDWILIDAPAAGQLPDAGLLGACSDGMLLAVALHRTAQETVQTAIRRLRSMNLPVKSCIVTRA